MTTLTGTLVCLCVAIARVKCATVDIRIDQNQPYEMYTDLRVVCDAYDFYDDFDYVDHEREIVSTLELRKDGKKITRNGDLIDSYLQNRTGVSIYFRPSDYQIGGTGTFSISNVNRNDSGHYQCLLNVSESSKDGNTTFWSEPQLVMVRYYPDPICSPPMIIQKGAETTVSCSLLEGTNTPVDVQWTASTPAVDLTAVSREQITRSNGSMTYVTSNLTLTTTDADINGELTCEISNEYVYKNCSIPIKTIWPSVNIHPVELSADIDSEAVFTCVFQFPVNSDPTWEWHSAPPIEPSRTDHLSSTTSTFTVRKLRTQDNGTTISCFAFFSDRWIQADAKLYVRDGKISAITTSIPSDAITQNADGGRSTGWKAGFSIVFIMMLVAIGAAGFLFWRLRPRGLRELFMQSIDRGKSETQNARHSLKAPAQESDPGETYTDLQNPSNTESNVQTDTARDTYTDLLQTPAEETHGRGSRENYGADTDDVYANEVTDERPDDSIYDFAENDDEEEQVYTNQQVIGSRYRKR